MKAIMPMLGQFLRERLVISARWCYYWRDGCVVGMLGVVCVSNDCICAGYTGRRFVEYPDNRHGPRGFAAA